MFLTDAKIQVSKVLTDFFFGAKNEPKIKFFRKKKPKRCVFQKGGLVGWLVGLDGLLFVMYVRKNFSAYPVGHVSDLFCVHEHETSNVLFTSHDGSTMFFSQSLLLQVDVTFSHKSTFFVGKGSFDLLIPSTKNSNYSNFANFLRTI